MAMKAKGIEMFNSMSSACKEHHSFMKREKNSSQNCTTSPVFAWTDRITISFVRQCLSEADKNKGLHTHKKMYALYKRAELLSAANLPFKFILTEQKTGGQ